MTNAATLPEEPQSWMMTEYIVDGTERHKCHCRVVSELAYISLRDQLAEAQREKERAYQSLELCGVNRERAKSVANGIQVFMTRTDRERNFNEQALRDLTARADANEKDAQILDWLEDESKCYWVEVQSQPTGDVVYAGSGKALREAIDAALAKS